MSRSTAAIAVHCILAVFLSACGDDTKVVAPKVAAPDAATSTDSQISGTDAVETDAGPDSNTDVQTGTDDAVDATDTLDAEDIAPDVSTCPGTVNCACADDTACNSGKCLQTPDGKKCAQPCTDAGCQPGYSCKSVGGGSDTSTYCVANYLTTCAPCQFNKDCEVNGVEALCLSYGSAGKFCGGTCKVDADCPSDKYACSDIKDEGTGSTVKQCKLKTTTSPGSGADCSTDATICAKGETCVAGKCAVVEQQICSCSEWAKGSGVETPCTNINDAGTCKGTRKCTPDGTLGACSAQVPALESCNGKDDDCDGTVDILLAPNNICTIAAYKKSGSGDACVKNDDCTKPGEGCDAAVGKCQDLIGTCTGTASCVSGTQKCDAKTPEYETCNGKDDNCDGKVDEDFPYTAADGTAKTFGDACGLGACGVGTVVCKDNLTSVCSTDSKKDPKGEACDGLDNDCNGKVDDVACDDTNPCTDDVCDGGTKTCAHNPNIAACDDKNPCTSADACGKGICTGQLKDCGEQCSMCDVSTGQCTNPAQGSSCDDKNACTTGDSCGKDPTNGTFSCLPGKEGVKCDDSNLCTDDVCNTQTGCVYAPNAGSSPCYEGADQTKDVGSCKAGTKYCKDGKLEAVCTLQIIPAPVETCDGKDDNCNGQTDEGCKPTSVAVTFSSAYVSGKSGNLNLQMLVGPSGPVGKAKGSGQYSIDFGFLSWLVSVFK